MPEAGRTNGVDAALRAECLLERVAGRLHEVVRVELGAAVVAVCRLVPRLRGLARDRTGALVVHDRAHGRRADVEREDAGHTRNVPSCPWQY